MRLMIKGGRIIDPVNSIDLVGDILVEDGLVQEISPAIRTKKAEVLDANGKIVCPGFIDMHVHLREPGFEYKEDIASGTRAAAVGGFTTVCCMPNTNPVIDNGAVAAFVCSRARQVGVVNVFPIGSITKKQQGTEISEMADLVQAGCVAVSDDGRPVMNAEIMRRALEYSRMFDIPVISHCEDLDLSEDGQMHEGFYSTLYGLKGIPAAAEEVMVARDILLAETTKSRVHFAHISTRGSVELIKMAKRKGLAVTCEVTPHHLTLTDEMVRDYDPDTKVNPPLRSREDVEALRQGLIEGVIDCIVTDHAPHEVEAKDCEYNLASCGISGLETAVAVILNDLVNSGIVDISDVVRLMSVNPANILKLDRGNLAPGKVADITILDLELERRVEPSRFLSKGKNNPFKGRVLKGWPWATIVRGRLVAYNGKLVV
ncbi:MAG TPA: dihydroorotase [Syntrophothermus lipocalidus]|uniref:Dihydroorotase n=1 Tax=Syntrophothermus lipocalidus (strain DSM 12680 / TGB-C1) TaxID=643648 RepID=D7CLN4_SYNLT|nr:dihydroorotase [Syntrophothermus lipocalidus]ADI01619.1 dihydroorotase, multifunctional complex type [Syntrophothermus lipocalidus DSM 12680]HHV77016.1 dihydroorotase [Syntrophothermus lipocalidus]HOV42622.1 dihydroorotase [Syntrophothermus lipocalidus]